MRCPTCGTDKLKVIDSRTCEVGASIRRRRVCENYHRFTTYERAKRPKHARPNAEDFLSVDKSVCIMG